MPAPTVAPQETPEWEPHEAARPTEDAGLPDETPADDGLSTPLDREAELQAAPTEEGPTEAGPVDGWGEETTPGDVWASEDPSPGEETWAEPTPTAMTEAVAFDQVEDDTGVAASEEELEPAESMETPLFETDTSRESAEDLPAAMPEEEPFEHAGRWWFKRGEEVLVYNEQTGEWVPSGTVAPPAAPTERAQFETNAEAAQTIGDISAATVETEETRPAAQGGFWRCPACGAVNGSTATTCRMCFAARPAG